MSVVGKQFKIEVESIDLGQILDGLRSRQESWKNTAIFLRDGFFPDDALVCEECSDPDEAEKLRGTMSALSAASNNRSTSKAACDYGCKNLVYRTNPATGRLHLQGGRIVGNRILLMSRSKTRAVAS